MANLLQHRPEVAPAFYSAELDLPDPIGKTVLTLSEHPGGRLTATIGQHDKRGWRHFTLTADATNTLRRALNQAYRERQRPTAPEED